MDIENLTGIGPKISKLFNKLEIYKVEDLIHFYPYKYNVYNFSSLDVDKDATIVISGVIESVPNVFFIKKNFNRMSFRVNVNNHIIMVSIFNRAFMKSNLTIGKEVCLFGKFDKSKNSFLASDIKFNIQNGDIEPIYHLTTGLSNTAIRKAIIEAFKKSEIKSTLPLMYEQKYNFIDYQNALYKIHFPLNMDNLKLAKDRLIYEELFNFAFKMNFLNKNNKHVKGLSRNIDIDKINTFVNNLPFKLTIDQQKAYEEIMHDLNNEKRMNRIVLGDVGSGKTIVAVIAMYANFLSGYQSALMAPTEILAMQHYYSIISLLANYPITVDIITGSMTKREKDAVYKRLASGQTNILVGTHSLLNDSVKFNNLGLVITDEQHRFGVNQRGVLQNKSDFPDVLYLSATPIPRTYAMTIYGDLDISIIKTKPMGRKEIITVLKKETEIKEVLLAMLEQIKLGHQIYVVCPAVSESDESNLNAVESLKEKIDMAFQNKIPSAIIHGKMKQAVKDSVMNDFKNNQTKILISTTVIEVGIDVSNATMIVIFNAERFGLATLHQLRGRVGRSNLQSYCYLVSNLDSQRLKVMVESNDGFYISEKDFELRGYGDLFGTRQHGDMTFKIADLKRDYDVLVSSKNDSAQFIESGEYLNYEYYQNLANSLSIVD